MSVTSGRYLVTLQLDSADHVAFWRTDDGDDRIELDHAGRMRTFASEAAARAAAHAEGHDVSPDAPARYDFDAIEAWCRSTDTVHDCVPLLDAWNLLGDLPREDKLFARADERSNAIYDKLFFGCNLPAMTAPGEHYTPHWNTSELAALKHLLLLGLAELRARLPH